MNLSCVKSDMEPEPEDPTVPVVDQPADFKLVTEIRKRRSSSEANKGVVVIGFTMRGVCLVLVN